MAETVRFQIQAADLFDCRVDCVTLREKVRSFETRKALNVKNFPASRGLSYNGSAT